MLSLPEEIISHVSGFLKPKDFYNMKTVISSGLTTHQRDQINCYYWWREEVPLARAAAAECPSLIRWVAEHDQEMESSEIVAAAGIVRTIPAGVALYDACRLRWSKDLPNLLNQWVEFDNSTMFQFQIARSQTSPDVFDTIYLHSKWLMLAYSFQYHPREFVAWTFGSFIESADPEIITNLKFVLHYLADRDRVVLIRILNKYHDWLWRTKLAHVNTIQTIASLQSLFVYGHQVIQFDPNRHLDQALMSPNHDALEYLLLRGIEVEPDMLQRTYDIKKLKLLMTAQVVQKYQKIIIMLIVLIMAIVMNIMITKSPPTPKLKRVL